MWIKNGFVIFPQLQLTTRAKKMRDRSALGLRPEMSTGADCCGIKMRFFTIIAKNFCYVKFREISGAMRYRAAGLKFFGAYGDRESRAESPATGPAPAAQVILLLYHIRADLSS